jgi:broad specificity phosphatase PhoE
MQLLLIRHAQPFHIHDPFGADPELTPEGRSQATLLASALGNNRYGHIDRLVSSTMLRAVQTAQLLARALSCELETDSRLVELDHGWETYGIDEANYPLRQSLWDEMNSGRIGANSFDVAKFSERVLAGLADLADGGPNNTTAVVCHGGVINAYLSDVIRTANPFFVEPFYTSVTRLRVDADGYRELLSVNEVDHLRL